MSTSETVEFDKGSCPCGKGKIVFSITTQDNPWSGADSFYFLSCPICESGWIIEGSMLVGRKEKMELNKARNLESERFKAVDGLIAPLIDQYFIRFDAKTMAAEHREMVRLNLTNSNIRNYRKAKNAGKAPSSVANAFGNMRWVRQLAAKAHLSEELAKLEAALADAKAETAKASKAVIYRKIA